MGSMTDKMKGVANQAGGKVKEGVGKAIGNEQMQVEGLAQQAKGKIQKKVGEAKSTVKDMADKRLSLQKRITELSDQRSSFVRDESKKQATTNKNAFDRALRETIREQAKQKGIEVPE